MIDERGGVPTSATSDEVVLAALGHAGLDDVRQRQHRVTQRVVGAALLGLGLAHLGGEILGPHKQRLPVGVRLRACDRLAERLLLTSHGVETEHGRAPLFVGGQQRVDERRVFAPGEL